MHMRLRRHPESPDSEKWKVRKTGLKKQLVKIPVYQDNNKRICYVRYADDFLIRVAGSKEDCATIKAELKGYLADVLKIELSDEKTKITHSSESARFLGYDVSVRRSQELKRRSDGVKQRALNGTVMLNAPLKDKIEEFLISNRYGFRTANGKIVPIAAKGLRNRGDFDMGAEERSIRKKTLIDICSAGKPIKAVARAAMESAAVIIFSCSILAVPETKSEYSRQDESR